MENKNYRTMKTPFNNLRQKKNNPSKPYLMLAELIDNSLGSWVMGGKGFDLNVVIVLDFKNGYISVEDNAFGMSDQELLDSVELHKEKTGNVMNMFGVGMKNAAFWFGEDLTIKTNNGSQTSATSVMLSAIQDDEWNKEITWKLEEMSTLNYRGTSVKIQNIYPDKYLTSDEVDELIDILETKYRKYLSGIDGNKLKMELTHKTKKGDQQKFTFEANPTIAQIINKNDISEFKEALEKEFHDEEDILFGLKDKVISLVENGKPIEFQQEILFAEKKLIFTFGITSQNNNGTNDSKHFKKRYGITGYQKDRAIRISGVKPIRFGKLNYTRTNIKRAYGFIELGEIFRPDNNKQDFNLGELKQEWDILLNKISKDMIRLCDAIHNTIGKKQTVKAGTKKDSRNKLQRAMNSKSEGFVWKIVNKKGAKASFVDSKNKEWEFEILEISTSDHQDKNYFMSVEPQEGQDKKFVITYNVNHLIWKPLANDNNAIDMKSVIYPLVAIMGLAHIAIKEELTADLFGELDNTTDYLSAISSLSKVGLKIEK